MYTMHITYMVRDLSPKAHNLQKYIIELVSLDDRNAQEVIQQYEQLGNFLHQNIKVL